MPHFLLEIFLYRMSVHDRWLLKLNEPEGNPMIQRDKM